MLPAVGDLSHHFHGTSRVDREINMERLEKLNENNEDLGERKEVVEENRKSNVGIPIRGSNVRLLGNMIGRFLTYPVAFVVVR